MPFSSFLPLNSSSLSSFSNNMLSEFGEHLLPFTKYHPEFPPAAPWEPAAISTFRSESLKPAVLTPSGLDRTLLTVFNAEAKPSPATTRSRNCEVGSEQKLASTLPVSNAPLINPIQTVSPDAGPSLRELVGRLGSNIPGNGFSALLCSSPLTSSLGPSFEKMLGFGNNWGSVNAASLIIDPSRGGLSIQGATSDPLENFTSDPGFAERAAKFSCFNAQTCFELAPPFPLTEGGRTYSRSSVQSADKRKLTRVSSCPPVQYIPSGTIAASAEARDSTGAVENCASRPEGAARKEDSTCIEKGSGGASFSSPQIERAEEAQKYVTSLTNSDGGDGSVGQGESSISDQGACSQENVRKKRKISPKDKSVNAARLPATNLGDKDSKRAVSDEPKAKRFRRQQSMRDLESMRDVEEQRPKVEQSNSGDSRDSGLKYVKECSKPLETPKPDYIHVRARRGQATDSHSLAERVRREKISERMKLLQDLVPGCSKITGKAVMLDEIINYVQSLQRQVEFLSMKLAAVTPRIDFNLDSIFSTEMFQSRGDEPGILFAQENANTPQNPLQVGVSCGVDVHPTRGPTDPAVRRTINTQVASMEAYGDALSQCLQKLDAYKPVQGWI